MRLSAAFFFAATLAAQTPVRESAPIGLVRGLLLQADLGTASGEFTIRSADAQILRFKFDSKTWFERGSERTYVAALSKGEVLEVVCDRETAPVRYARLVHVMEKPVAPRRRYSAGLYRIERSPIEDLAPRGNMTYSGIVASVLDDRMLVRTRLDGEKLIYLRRDTRYLEDGSPVEAGTLHPNTRVFIRAGKNLDDDLEAYQIIWGQILRPGP